MKLGTVEIGGCLRGPLHYDAAPVGGLNDIIVTIARFVPRPARRFAKARLLPPVLRSARYLAGSRPEPPRTTRFSVPGCESFVGYYDVQPTSADDGAILGHVLRAARRPARPDDLASVGYFERDGGRFVEVARTTLWCWQLGARLRWWPGERRALAFNAIIDGAPSFCVVSAGGRPERLCDRPLFDASADGRTGIALNFGRLAKVRPGYGYPALDDPFADEPLPERDGVTIVDMASGRAELLFPMSAFARLAAKGEEGAFHYLNGASLSPTGKRFSVLYKRIASIARPHEWRVDAVVGNTDGTALQRVPLPGRASHYWWLDDDRIAYTANTGWHSEYCVFDPRAGSLNPLHPGAPGVDGHPSLHFGTGRWITDTYPDLYGEQALYVLEPDGSRRETGRFPADRRYRDEWRCDLHPRWWPDGRSVIVDSTHDGVRAIHAVEVAP